MYFMGNFFKKNLAFLLVLSFTAGCSFFTGKSDKPPTAEEGSHSSFIVDEIKEGRVVAVRVNGLPEEIKISYKACFRDFIQVDQSLPSNVFNVHLFENLNGQSVECSESSSFVFSKGHSKVSCLKIRTDASGCLNWTEVYPYSASDRSVWFRYERGFEGTGINKGLTLVPFAINPWLSLGPSGSDAPLQLVDLRYDSIDEASPLVRLEKKDILECRLCKDNQDNGCTMCRNKQKSLSVVMSKFSQSSGRPRLWVNEVNSYIRQEHFYLKQPSEEQKAVLKKFQVCEKEQKSSCDPAGRFFKVHLELPLRILVQNHRNEPELLPLTKGNYQVKPYLFLVDDKGRHISLHREVNFISAELVHGARENDLRLDFYFHVPYENYGLPAFLALKVLAQDNKYFLPFEGVFAFPDTLKTVMGSNKLPLENNVVAFYKKNPQSKKSLINTAYQLSNDTHLNRDKEGFRRAGWNAELRRLRFSDVNMVEGKCPTPVDRHIRYVGEVCIIDPLTNSVVPNTNLSIKRQEFKLNHKGELIEGPVVQIENTYLSDSEPDSFSSYQEGQRYDSDGREIKSNYYSDTSGCLRWVDHLHHKWYNRQKYFVRKMIFSKDEWGFEGERMIAINPWHWGFVFYQDITQIGPSSIRTSSRRAEKPRIVLHDFRNIFVEPIYTIDKWLGINIFQNLVVLFKARVDRPDDVAVSQGGIRPSARDVRRGYYIVRFILVKSHVEEAGGRGNLVVKDEDYRKTYQDSLNQPWNTNMGWKLARDGQLAGQMMNTNLEYITHFDTYVQIRDGTINAYTNFTFDLDEFIFIGSNNRMIVQIFPTHPEYYVYQKDSCEVDPDKTVFKPYTDHELISQAFLGTFVPNDQRNWNVWRVLDDSFLSELFDSSSKVKGSYMDVTSKNLYDFVEKGEKESTEHEFFRKLNSTMTVQSGSLGDKSKLAVRDSKVFFEDFYKSLKNFLSLEDSLREDLVDSRKNHLIESIHSAILFLGEALNGSPEGEELTDFFHNMNVLLRAVLKSFENNQSSYSSLRQTAQESLKSYIALVERYLPLGLSDSEKEELLNIASRQNKWLNPSVELPEKPEDFTFFNMDRFAKQEGLRVIAWDLENSVSEFIKDLNKSSAVHNHYRDKFFIKPQKLKKNIANNVLSLIGLDVADEEESPAGETNTDPNFSLMEGDNYSVFSKKVKRLFLPEFKDSWLKTILQNGIHTGTLDSPEVMTFLHALCGFWFNDFYSKYLKSYQLDSIYDKHMDHFHYYKSTLEYSLKNKNSSEQYVDLQKAMEKYHLRPMNKNALELKSPFVSHPFSPQRRQESSSDPVTASFYQEMPGINRVLSALAGASSMYNSYAVGSRADVKSYSQVLNSYRHPYFKCTANPLSFFHTEKKIIVGDIGSDYSDLMYEYGQTRAFNAQRAFDYSYAASWNMSRGFSNSLGSGFTFLGGGFTGAVARFLNPLTMVSPVMAFNGIKVSSDWSTGRSDSESNRRQQSLRFAKGLYLMMNHSVISIALKQYRLCLAVRAKNLAFDGYKTHQVWTEDLQDNFVHQIPYIKSGLLICTKNISAEQENRPLRIKEDYFYIYQPNQGDRGQFLNPLNYLNRPYVITVRGITELEKVEFLMHSFIEADKKNGVEDYNPERPMTNPFHHQPPVADGARRAIKQAQVWNRTGFYPGIYTVKYDEEHYYFRSEEYQRGSIEKMGEWLYEHNPFTFIHFDDKGSVTRSQQKQ